MNTNYTQFCTKLRDAFSENRLSSLLDDEKAKKLFEFYLLLTETNKSMNLTAITSEDEVILKHFVDCAFIAQSIGPNLSVIDVGCGGGFPTIPLSIVRPDLSVTALDSTQKKIDFVQTAANELELGNVTPICGRAEEVITKHREQFDGCVSRAVARLNVLAEICLPFVKVGGYFTAMKSNRGGEEYKEAEKGIKLLGGSLSALSQADLKFAGIHAERELYNFQKTAATPKAYPRRYAQILKKPL